MKHELANFKHCFLQGQKAAIVGKGSSLDSLTPEHLAGFAAIFCLNESIQVVEKLVEPLRIVFVVQQDCDPNMAARCVPRQKHIAHFMNENQTVSALGEKARVEKVAVSPWNPDAVLYNPLQFGAESPNCELSANIAVQLAKFMGLRNVTFLCFDAWHPGGSCEYAASLNVGRSSGAVGEPGRHCSHREYILTRAKELGMVTKIGYQAKE